MEKVLGKIAILPDVLCSQIAAGEVVERPAAVVKELVENSLDAGSRRIFVSLLDGGRKEIRVADNGEGMHPDDALLALERHATSKIRRVEDLHTVTSMGFRGEAIPSIAAVSRFELTTREPHATAGTVIRVEGGTVREVRETGCPAGTLVVVRDLFFNLPARRKFMRSVETETSHILDRLLRSAISRPDIHFQVSHQNRTVYDFPTVADVEKRAAQALGGDLAARLRPFSLEEGAVRIHGLVAPPDIQRASLQSLFLYVNGRPVQDKVLNRGALAAFENLLPRGKYPVAVVFLEIPPEWVDVNVHPAKQEVRFSKPGRIIEMLRRAVRAGLGTASPRTGPDDPWGPADSTPFHPGGAFPGESFHESRRRFGNVPVTVSIETPPPEPVQERFAPSMLPGERRSRITDDPFDPPRLREGGSQERPPAFAPRERRPGGRQAFETPSPSTGRTDSACLTPSSSDRPFFSILRVLGQIADAYILLEDSGGLIVIDQHAAHERVVFERLSADASAEPGQRLLNPAVVNLQPREAAVLTSWTRELTKYGFDIDAFGGGSFMVRAVPAVLAGIAPEELLREIIGTACEDEGPPRFDLLHRLTKTAACHGAVRTGMRLRPEEIKKLLDDLDSIPIHSTCPHGRPFWRRISLDELAKGFHRT